jgi:UDP-N-acetylglucosamine 4-epimerase
MDAYTPELEASPRRWVVTGAAGFIGSHIAERLLDLGQSVVGLDNFSTGHRENIEDLLRAVESRHGQGARDRFELQVGDIRDAETCQRATEAADHVIHQAALGSVPRSIKEPITTHDVNVTGFLNMLEATRHAGCKNFVYASSSSIYGDSPALPKTEDEIGRPLSPYAASKQTNEVYATAWGQSYGLACRGLRYFNVVGPRQDPQGAYAAVIPRWISEFLTGGQPTIFGDGETSRDFCPIENVVQANLLAALAPKSESTVFNVALGGRTTLNELFIILRDGMKMLGIDRGRLDARYEDFRPGDVRHSLADISRACAELGYQPSTKLREGLERTMAWFVARESAAVT